MERETFQDSVFKIMPHLICVDITHPMNLILRFETGGFGMVC